MSQTHAILRHLKKGRPIDPLTALNQFGCFRLGARIWDLKRQGVEIKTKIVHQGDKHFARYSLA